MKLLGSNGLRIPFAIITDEDPVPDKNCLAHNRVANLVKTIDPDYKYSEETSSLFEEAEEDGVFVTEHTLEVALFKCGRHKSLTTTIEQLSTNSKAHERAQQWRANTKSLDTKQFLADIEQIGKGRFAQRLSSRISTMTSTACPPSGKQAVTHVIEQL